ncbi:peptide ABC transporter substrate-binding protein [Microbacterium saccharophilum]|uniref:Peptide ABC transporter substrate-binding protein n=1 Tax=Microbacterium saccharophilum TaxID=1213358 RepID=A0A5C8HSJ9_9MICO|nr:ABC transporter substrate-binding protein [Microbacterium saccharophilum]TXK08850.1 peptide ABC transporter substrate-binding protein [Microbacterium saccharophilum]GEP48141.1 peptide ABC transporter permease [Microbacterium saccharophilum]
MTRNTRRLALAAATAVSAMMMSACATAGSETATPDATEITVALALPTSWDPITSRTGFDINTISLAYASLTRLDADGAVQPSLAESWEYSDDGTAITFTLRDGLTFSDGEPVDAAAVKAFFDRGTTQEDSHLKDQLADLKEVTVDSELEVTLHLTEVDYQIPYLVAGRTGAIASPEAGTDPARLAIEPVGAGPFILTDFVPESQATFVKNPDYWDAENIHIDELVLKPRLDAATVVAAIQSGSVDVAVIPATQVDAAEAAGIDVTIETALTASDASINLNKAPFDDPAVVEAFRYAFDRQAFVDAVTAGRGSVTHQPFPEGYLAFNPAVEDLWDYDPAKAKQLLADAGYEEGELSVGITAQAGAEVAAELTQAQLEAIGVNSTISVVPAGSTTWQDEVYVAKSPQLALDGTIGRESPVANLLATYGPQGIMNLSGPHATEEFQAALDAVRATPIDAPEYQQVLWDAVEVAVTQSPTNYLYSSPWIFATSEKVGDLNLLPSQVRWEGVTVNG